MKHINNSFYYIYIYCDFLYEQDINFYNFQKNIYGTDQFIHSRLLYLFKHGMDSHAMFKYSTVNVTQKVSVDSFSHGKYIYIKLLKSLNLYRKPFKQKILFIWFLMIRYFMVVHKINNLDLMFKNIPFLCRIIDNSFFIAALIYMDNINYYKIEPTNLMEVKAYLEDLFYLEFLYEDPLFHIRSIIKKSWKFVLVHRSPNSVDSKEEILLKSDVFNKLKELIKNNKLI